MISHTESEFEPPDPNMPAEASWASIEMTLAERIAQRDCEDAEACLDEGEKARLMADDSRESGLRVEPREGDPAMLAIDRLAQSTSRIQGAIDHARFLRKLADWAMQHEVNVADRLHLIADVMEARR